MMIFNCDSSILGVAKVTQNSKKQKKRNEQKGNERKKKKIKGKENQDGVVVGNQITPLPTVVRTGLAAFSKPLIKHPLIVK